MSIAVDPPAITDGAWPRLRKLAGRLLRKDEWAVDASGQSLRAARDQASGPAACSARAGILERKLARQLRERGAEFAADAEPQAGAGETIAGFFDAFGTRAAPVLDWGDTQTALSSREFIDTMTSCIEQLPPELASALLLRESMQFDTAAICRTLDISACECQARLLLARLRLSESLQRRWFSVRTSQLI